jgi:hypothetical protein
MLVHFVIQHLKIIHLPTSLLQGKNTFKKECVLGVHKFSKNLEATSKINEIPRRGSKFTGLGGGVRWVGWGRHLHDDIIQFFPI